MSRAEPENLLGVDSDLDDAILNFSYLTDRYAEFHPANTGDVSQVLSRDSGQNILDRFGVTASDWYNIDSLQKLALIRGDGRSGYRSEGINDDRYYEILRPLYGRLMLVTRTGAELPSLRHTIESCRDGMLLNIIEVSGTGRQLRIVYGNSQYGSIPSIETHLHMVSNAMSVAEGEENPSTVHTHPYHLVALGRYKSIGGDFHRFNAALYTGIEGINRNHQGLVAVCPYHESGTEQLVLGSLDGLERHKLVLLMNHGFVTRTESISRGYTLTAYAESSARSALDTLIHDSVGLPRGEVDSFLQRSCLEDAYNQLFPNPQVLGAA